MSSRGIPGREEASQEMCALSTIVIGGSLGRFRFGGQFTGHAAGVVDAVCRGYRCVPSNRADGQKGVTDEFINVAKDANDAGCGHRFHRAALAA